MHVITDNHFNTWSRHGHSLICFLISLREIDQFSRNLISTLQLVLKAIENLDYGC